MKRNFALLVLLLLTVALPAGAFGAANPIVVVGVNYDYIDINSDDPIIGNIVIELYPDDAPITVDNFLSYVNSGYYNDLLFHRVMNNFMIQGGFFLYFNDTFYYRGTNAPILNESYNGLSNLRGTIAMARTGESDSATSQFFINHIDNLFLDKANADDGVGYCVFGNVIAGMDLVDEIALLPTIQNGLSTYFPNDPKVEMYSVAVLPCDSAQCSDLSGNGKVDFADMAIMAAHWLDDDCDSANNFCNGTDLNYNGTADEADMAIFAANWLATVSPEPQTVPEPQPAE